MRRGVLVLAGEGATAAAEPRRKIGSAFTSLGALTGCHPSPAPAHLSTYTVRGGFVGREAASAATQKFCTVASGVTVLRVGEGV